jgi:hypothetical protein
MIRDDDSNDDDVIVKNIKDGLKKLSPNKKARIEQLFEKVYQDVADALASGSTQKDVMAKLAEIDDRLKMSPNTFKKMLEKMREGSNTKPVQEHVRTGLRQCILPGNCLKLAVDVPQMPFDGAFGQLKCPGDAFIG